MESKDFKDHKASLAPKVLKAKMALMVALVLSDLLVRMVRLDLPARMASLAKLVLLALKAVWALVDLPVIRDTLDLLAHKALSLLQAPKVCQAPPVLPALLAPMAKTALPERRVRMARRDSLVISVSEEHMAS